MSQNSQPPTSEDRLHFHLTSVDANGQSNVPDGTVPLYAVEGHIARRMIDLQLHKVDLRFVSGCCQLLAHKYETHSLENEAIWTAAMVRFFKCFGSTNGGRSQLSAKRVFQTEPSEAMAAFEHLETLRNKTLVHDQNSFMQGKLGVQIIRSPNAKPVLSVPLFMSFVAMTLDHTNISNLNLLTQAALKWIQAEYAEKERTLMDELKNETAEAIVARGPVTWTSPSYETAGQSKQDKVRK